MRYVVMGAGAIGGTIGGRLWHAGHDVLLVARGAHHRALRGDGLTLRTPDQTLHLNVPVTDGTAGDLTLRDDDVLILATKTQDTLTALDTLLGLPMDGGGDPSTLPVVCAQNGVHNERLALRRFAHVYAMLVWLPATHLRPGEVTAVGTPRSGILDLGRYPVGSDETATRIAADLSASGFAAVPRTDVMPWKYGKLLSNLSNAAEAAGGHGDDWQDIHRRARAEGEACLNAAGIAYPTRDQERERRDDLVQRGTVDGQPPTGGSSWQSLARGTGSIEADYLNGEITLLGREHGVPTPVNDALQRAVRVLARDRRPPGDLTVAELTGMIAAP